MSKTVYPTGVYTEKYRIWCSSTDKYLNKDVADDGYSYVYGWTTKFTAGMTFPESELASMSDVLDGTFKKDSKNTFVFEVVGAAILATGKPLADFYLIPIRRGFGEVQRLL